MREKQSSQHQNCRQSIRHQIFTREHYVERSEVATLVSMIPNFWCNLEVASAELHRCCVVIKGNVWLKCTLLPVVAIVVLHHKQMKPFKPFPPHVFAWFVRKGFNQSIRKTKKQKTRLQCLA